MIRRSSSDDAALSFLLVFVVLFHSFCLISMCHGLECWPSKCSDGGPEIRFPFRLLGLQLERCGYPGFELTCDGENTVLHLPSSQKLSITEINYFQSSMTFANPNGCNEELLLSLNLTASPFYYKDYYGYLEDYTMVDCSINITTFGHSEILCLRNSSMGHHVFIVNSGFNLTGFGGGSCKSIGNIGVQNLYSYNDLGRINLPYLNWYVQGCDECGGVCRYKNDFTNQTECFCSYLCSSVHNKGTRIKKAIIGVGITIFILTVVAVIVFKVCQSKRLGRKKEMENQLKVEKFLEDYKSLKPIRYSYLDIKRMTDHFRHKLGQGGYGTVFKGNLANGALVAVKILKKSSGSNGDDFINEVGTIGRIHHVNVVRLLGFCAERHELRALVYEFMPNESLEKIIFSSDDKSPVLGWEKLQHIAIGIAKGIEYLHQGCDQRILHFDIKPHNILLDHNFNPKISDFGLAKLCSKEESIVSVTAAKGTMGYIAPEVFSRNFGNVSHKSDVYSFGMVLLEMVGGRKNINTAVENASQVYFPQWIYDHLHQGEELGLRIVEEEDAAISKKLTIVALWCIQWYPMDRPSMNSVVQMLEGSMDSLMIPPNPFGSTSQSTGCEKISENLESTKLTIISE